MSAIYPLQFLRLIEQQWTAHLAHARNSRRSNPAGTHVCECGEMVVAPIQSTYSTVGVINEWHCTKCDHSSYTYADPIAEAERVS